MYKRLIFLVVVLLMACSPSGGSYDNEINSVVEYYQNDSTLMIMKNSDHIVRENSSVSVYDDGRFIKIAFYNGDKDISQSLNYKYFEFRSGEVVEIDESDFNQNINSEGADYQEQFGETID